MARRILALDHQAKLISPQFVRPFVQGNKNDFADAQAICEAASRPSMRLVSARNEAQQTVSALRRVRESLVRERTGVINQVHALLLEFGISPPRGQAIIRRCRQCWPSRSCRLGWASGGANCWQGVTRTWWPARWPINWRG